MESLQSKQRKCSEPEPKDPNKLSPLCHFMKERYPGSCKQFGVWVELGFPEEGSLSDRQLTQLKKMLRRKVESDCEKYEAFSKKQRRGFAPFKADWKAYTMWKDECQRRETRQLKSQNKKEEKRKKEQKSQTQNINQQFPLLSELNPGKVHPDLNSAPPPPYNPAAPQPVPPAPAPPPPAATAPPPEMAPLHQEEAEAGRRSCSTWKSCSLADILQHAEHEEDIQKRQDALKKEKKQEKLDEAQLTMYNAMTSGARGRRRGRGRDRFQNAARGKGRGPWDPEECFNCREKGHWANECPHPRREGRVAEEKMDSS